MSPSAVPDVELPDVLGPVAILALGLDIHLPLAAEAVEVVDERPSHERLNRSVDVLDVDPLLEHLVAIDVDELLRHVGRNVVLTEAISGRLRAAAMNLFVLPARNATSPPERSSRTNVKPPDVPTPGMAGGENENAMPCRRPASFWFTLLRMNWYCSSRVLPFAHSFNVTKKNAL